MMDVSTAKKPAQTFRAIACDLDGTLLRSDATVSSVACEVLTRLVDQGVHVTLASGRPPASIARIARELGVEGAMVGLNGAVTFTTDGRILARDPMSPDLVSEVLDVLEEFDEVGWSLYSEFDWWVSEMTPGHAAEAKLVGVMPEIAAAADLRGRDADKFILYGPYETQLKAVERMQSLGLELFGHGWTELGAPGVTKLTGLRHVADHHGVTVDDFIAFGDHDNDPAMLAGVGLGVAMGHASEKARAAAKRVIGSNDDDAVPMFLAAHFGLTLSSV